MKIGIDARFLTHPQLGGFKTYTENLIKGISQIDDTNSYVIYLDRLSPTDYLPHVDNFTYRVVDGTLPVIGMPVREQISLRRCFAEDRLEVIHFLCNTAPIYVREKFIVTLHDTIQVKSNQTFNLKKALENHKLWIITEYSKWVTLMTARYARRIITVSNFEKTEISHHMNIPPQRIQVTHLAPNPIFTQYRPEVKKAWCVELREKFDLDGEYILGIGWEPRKNIPLLIEAFSQVTSTKPDLHLVIVAAQESQRIVFQQMARDRNLGDRVKILDALPPSELRMLYSLAEAFVFPSERESFGLPPLEAMACGTPTIAMNICSIEEVVRDGALLVDGKDAHNWANAIKKVLLDKNMRSELETQGIQRAAQLTWQRCAQETIQIYRSVVEESQDYLPNPDFRKVEIP